MTGENQTVGTNSPSLRNRVIALFPQLLAVGGVQQASRLVASALQDIAAHHDWAADFFSLNDPSASKTLRVDASDIPIRGFGRAKVRFVLAAARQSKKQARVLLAAHPNLAVPAMMVQGATANIQTIVISHGIEVWHPLPALQRYALQRANLVLAPSRYTIAKLIEIQRLPPEKVWHLPWPLDPAFLRLSSKQYLSPTLAFPAGRIILTVGRWSSSEKYKGCDHLIEAVAGLSIPFPDLSLLAVGTGDDLPRLSQIASKLGVADRVHFMENLSQEEVAACYARADVFALPSTGEGFGLVFLEAMAFAKPVIGTAVGGPVDLIEDGVNGFLLPPHDKEKLVESLHRLLSDASLRAEMGRCGAEIVQQRYRFDVFRASLENILAECRLG